MGIVVTLCRVAFRFIFLFLVGVSLNLEHLINGPACAKRAGDSVYRSALIGLGHCCI